MLCKFSAKQYMGRECISAFQVESLVLLVSLQNKDMKNLCEAPAKSIQSNSSVSIYCFYDGTGFTAQLSLFDPN